ncbi:MAG TPA: hypothetical protein VH722_20440 [Alphaproteobacteria bacterium]|nr:hypothetical protein [Alphaproteobacteria bacterium]
MKSSAHRETLTAEEWRARARHLREFALSVLDERTFQRMEQRARDYDHLAALADAAAPAPAAAIPEGELHDG